MWLLISLAMTLCTVFQSYDSQHFLQKAYSVKNGSHYIVSYVCNITLIESDYFRQVKTTAKQLYQMVYL